MKNFFNKNKFWIGVLIGGVICAWFASKNPETTQRGFSNTGKAVKDTATTCKTKISSGINYISEQIKKRKG